MAALLGTPWNRRATCDASPSNARSESQISANPLDPYNLVASSKRFTDPTTYAFSLACYASFDGAQTWTESGPLGLLAGWAGLSDPALAWDNAGHCYLVALPIGPGANSTIGIAVYTSPDGGRTWSAPNLIHSSGGDDKQWAVADTNPASPKYGNVYAAWDDGGPPGTLRFARTTDHGATWKGVTTAGVDEPAGSALATDSVFPGMAVAPDGSLYIFWTPGSQVKFVKSSDGGNTFSAPAVAASGITNLGGSAPIIDGWNHLPGGTFRVITNCNAACGSGDNVVVAWADYREGRSRIYYRRSANGGGSWQGSASGQPLLTGALESGANQHDFHPQLASLPSGEIGCAFYEFGPRGGGEFPSNLIDTTLALSTNGGLVFSERAVVTDAPWDPTVDAPWSHGNSNVTFIGDYFGLAANRLGFFPAWTDTRTGVQEIFTSRMTYRPADLVLRDSSSDTGDVPSPGNHWEAPDLIVRRQPDGDTTFVDEDLLRDGHTDHYVYARVRNRGAFRADNVQLAVVVGNYPSLHGLPGAEFNYPRDWYSGDWTSPAETARHLALSSSTPAAVNAGQTKIIGPVLWPAAQIPPEETWHPCLLAEARADNDANHGGNRGAPIDSGADPCNLSAYFWGVNGVAQRNLSYAPVPAAAATAIEFPFLLGSLAGPGQIVEVIVDKGRHLAKTDMVINFEPVPVSDTPGGEGTGPEEHDCRPACLSLLDPARVVISLADGKEIGRLDAPAGLKWCPADPCAKTEPTRVQTPAIAQTTAVVADDAPRTGAITTDPDFGGQHGPNGWEIKQPRGSVRVPIDSGHLVKATLRFTTPRNLEPGSRHLVRIYQRRGKTITGGVFLQIQVQQ